MKLRVKLIYLVLIVLGLLIGMEYGVLRASAYFILVFASCALTVDVE
jgi:hypothetical protein